MKKIQNFKTLMDELYNLQNIEDKRLIILNLFLFSEHYSLRILEKNNIENKHKIICDKCNNELGETDLSLNERIGLLIEKNIIKNELQEPFNILSKIRNRMIHDIFPDNKKIISWIKEYDPPTNEEVKSLLQKEDAWDKFLSIISPSHSQFI